MTEAREAATDWAGNLRSYLLLWGVPLLAVAGGALVDPPLRTGVWIAALVWMGAACLMNARRCGRTHCRYTGPFYLLLTIPVLLDGLGLIFLGTTGWWLLGLAILFGGKLIWWTTEAAWGKYSTPR